VAACSSAKPSPIVVYTTATPAPTMTLTPLPTLAPTPLPELTPTPSGSVAASATAGVSASPSTSPSAGPTGPADACNGFSAAKAADNRAFFLEAAKKLSFGVYCGHVSAGWYFNGGTYTQPSGGKVTIEYKNSSGGKIDIAEGYCPGACPPAGTHVGSASFGDLSGDLYTVGSGYAIYVSGPRTYTATGTGVTQSTFVNLIAALVKVPKI
jgi:hypothetical protein